MGTSKHGKLEGRRIRANTAEVVRALVSVVSCVVCKRGAYYGVLQFYSILQCSIAVYSVLQWCSVNSADYGVCTASGGRRFLQVEREWLSLYSFYSAYYSVHTAVVVDLCIASGGRRCFFNWKEWLSLIFPKWASGEVWS